MGTREDIINYLVEESEGDYTREELEAMDGFDLLDAYLQWEGICGYTRDIIDAVNASGVLD